MSAKQGLAGALALAMTVWLANAAAAEGTTDAVPVSATPLSHHVPAQVRNAERNVASSQVQAKRSDQRSAKRHANAASAPSRRARRCQS